MKSLYLIIVVFSLALISCQNNEKKDSAQEEQEGHADTTKPAPNPYINSKIDFQVFSNDTTADSLLHGYGYNIIIDGKLYVHQPHIPAVSGNNGFSTIANAEKAAALIVYKIKNNVMPPSVTSNELDSVGALK